MYQQALSTLDLLVEDALAKVGGCILDAELAGEVYGFDSLDEAVRFCRDVHTRALELDWSEALLERADCAPLEVDGVLAFRGLRPAFAVDLQHPDEEGLHVLSRLISLAAPGGVVFSAWAAGAWDGEVVDLGSFSHAGLRGCRRIYGLPLLGREFAPPSPPPWPNPRMPLIGREGDLAALDELSSLGIRVVCVSGEPGSGTSRLLRRFTCDQAARGIRVVAVDLETACDAWDVLTELARAIGVPVRESRGKSQVVHRIAAAVMASPGMVLVIDHASADFSAEIIRDVVRLCPGSRWTLGGIGRLGVPAEVAYLVGPMNDVAAGAQLFDAAALRVDATFESRGGSESLAIAKTLDGNPLALELAAACVSDLSPLALFDRLASACGPALRVINLVLSLRSPEELECLQRLSVFRSAFSRDAARSVSGCTAETLASLENTGIVQVIEPRAAPGAQFLHLHPKLRDALGERAPVDDDVEMRLAEWLAESCDGWRAALWTDRAEAVLARMSLERENLRAVVSGLEERPRLSAAEIAVVASLLEGALSLAMWEDAVSPLLDPLEGALQAVGMCLDADPIVAVRLFRTRGVALERLGQVDAALEDLRRARSLAERWEKPEEVAQARFHAGRVRAGQGLHEFAATELRAALENFEGAGLVAQQAETRVHLAKSLVMLGDESAARELLDTAEEQARGRASWLVATVAENRAILQRRAGQRDEARKSYTLALELWRTIGRWDEATLVCLQLGLLLHSMGELDAAEELLRRAETVAKRWGDSPRRGIVLTQIGLVQLERGERAEAHKNFIRAVSACRAGGDRAGQGAAKGFMGLLHHLAGRLDEAREGYRAALRDLESGGDRRYGALFHSCLGAVEAELGNLDDAGILVDLAQIQLPDVDPRLRDAMLLFHHSIDLARAEAAEGAGDLVAAKDLRRGVELALAAVDEQPANIYLRFARSHLVSLIGEAS